MNRLGLEEMTPPKLETVNRRERRDFNYLDFLMKQFYLFRHAQSQANVGGIPLPDREIPITKLGQQQALNRCKQWEIQPSALYCSQLLRTQQTALPFMQKYQLPLQQLSCLNEFSYLDFEMIRTITTEQRQQLSAQYWLTSKPEYKYSPQCDSFLDFSQRIDEFCQNINTFPNNSLFFTHGIWLAQLSWKILGYRVNSNQDMQRFRQFTLDLAIPNTATFLLTVNNHCLQLQYLLDYTVPSV
ncbi:histidine phosphatase family protein [Gallibacterium anatis]|uniref:histidine phosphatase family protein n=1 Tax=Gallibacterium anatis TaxID=750 RepID=UPI0039FC682C